MEETKMKILGVIPARYASTRLPGKPLVPIAGKPMILWVVEALGACETLDGVLVATDDERIAAVVRAAGGEVVMTSPECPSGTDRIAQAIVGRPADIVVNIQGDEPLIDACVVDRCVRALIETPEAAVSTACTPIRTKADYDNINMVKVTIDKNGMALYFSRSSIPNRERSGAPAEGEPWALKHLGLYVYRRPALEKFVTLERSPYEKAEKLEQLRLLQAGLRMKVITVEDDSLAVDTPSDITAVEAVLKSRGQ